LAKVKHTSKSVVKNSYRVRSLVTCSSSLGFAGSSINCYFSGGLRSWIAAKVRLIWWITLSSRNFPFGSEPVLVGCSIWTASSLPKFIGESGDLLSVLRLGDFLQSRYSDPIVLSCGGFLQLRLHVVLRLFSRFVLACC